MRNHSNENDFDLHENGREAGTHFHMNGFARRLVLEQRQRVTRKWPNLHILFSAVKCTCPSRAETDDPKGRCCAFPFTYGIKAIGSQRTYYTCTLTRRDRFWCSLDAKYKGNWANCAKKLTLS